MAATSGVFCGTASAGTVYQFEWARGLSRVTANPNGVTGWATVVHCLGGSVEVGSIVRVHVCRHSPCRVDWDASKYGEMGPPIHIQRCDDDFDTACATISAPSAVAEAEAMVPATAAVAVEAGAPGAATASAASAVAEAEAVVPATDAVAVEAGAPAAAQASEELQPSDVPVAMDTSTPPKLQDVHPEQAAASGVSASPSIAPPEGHALRPGHVAPPLPSTCRPQFRPAVVMAPLEESADRLTWSLLNLARDIRRQRNYVGYSFFVLLALRKKVCPYMWEGSNLVNLLQTYAPWAVSSCEGPCAMQGVCCCCVPDDAGMVRMCPVSVEHPLHECRHFVAGHTVDVEVSHEGASMHAFYNGMGVILIPTVADGDCGPDTACLMLGIERTLDTRCRLRGEIADFLAERAHTNWMIDLMAACQELSADEVAKARSGGCASCPDAVVDLDAGAAPAEESSVALVSAVADAASEVAEGSGVDVGALVEALEWRTKLKDENMLHRIAMALPPWAQREQLHAFQERTIVSEVPPANPTLILDPRSLQSKMKAVEAFEKHWRSAVADGARKTGRAPRGSRLQFLQLVQFRPGLKGSPTKWLGNALQHSRKRHALVPLARSGINIRIKQKKDHELQRARGAGRPWKALWVREALFDWFVSMRYAIDWKKRDSMLRKCGRHKLVGRFPRALFVQRAKMLTQQYIEESLLLGKPVEVPDVNRSDWNARFEADYGLSLRRPNRRYKIPKSLAGQRCEIGWLNVARVRALCLAVHGYDPELENMDQSPYYKNQAGSSDARTIAVAGSLEVPLLENHSATRQRVTGAFTTWSNKERILDEGPPPAEIMIRADGERLLDRLKEHIRSRGYGPWLSVAASPKASYTEPDVLCFLDRHIPPMSLRSLRRWRIYLTDDFASHKTKNVERLLWGKGSVSMNHGGGVTPILQTNDTDQNQHVKREYVTLESALMLRLMQAGQVVPTPSDEQIIDMMADVLSRREIHMLGADGYKKTGMGVALDGSEDHLVCREAGVLWKEYGMREKINREVALVREEFRAGRLSWTQDDVRKLIQPYPRHAADEVLTLIEGTQWFLNDSNQVGN